MKKLFSLYFFFLGLLPTFSWAQECDMFSTAFTAGYVFKRDCNFHEAYSLGAVNAITGDFCYYPWEHWGIGTKVSYWFANGHTTFLSKCSHVAQVPLTVYLRGIKSLACDLDVYASIGGGFIWTKEKSYLGCTKFYKGIGELEVGFNYPIFCDRLNLTSAFRYLFPRQQVGCCKGFDVGGFDLRGGFSLVF